MLKTLNPLKCEPLAQLSERKKQHEKYQVLSKRTEHAASVFRGFHAAQCNWLSPYSPSRRQIEVNTMCAVSKSGHYRAFNDTSLPSTLKPAPTSRLLNPS